MPFFHKNSFVLLALCKYISASLHFASIFCYTVGMKQQEHRSDCPINFALESFGDKWSLLIIRDIVFSGKTSYGQFLESDEKIATNILSSRLKTLGDGGIITKQRDPHKKTKYIYKLAPRGLELMPLLVDLIIWAAECVPMKSYRQTMLELERNNRAELIQRLQANAKASRPIWEDELFAAER